MISLYTVGSEHYPLIKEWAESEELSEFFRRCAPFFVWGTPENVLKTVAGSYIIRRDDEPIGMVSFFNADANNRKVDFGVLVDKTRCKERGLVAKEATKQGLEYIFNHLGYERVVCQMLEHRTQAHQILTASGFIPEGTLRHSAFWRGKFHNEIQFSLLADDFRRLHSK